MRQVLTGLGFPPAEHHMPLAHLSGGQRTRGLLARLLLQEPDLLLMDEPTNHLDLHATEWLEQVLLGWNGSMVVVSHDRYFLDRVATRIWELAGQQTGGLPRQLQRTMPSSGPSAASASARSGSASSRSSPRKRTSSAATSPARTPSRPRAGAPGWSA